jgi:hypothetical protein
MLMLLINMMMKTMVKMARKGTFFNKKMQKCKNIMMKSFHAHAVYLKVS